MDDLLNLDSELGEGFLHEFTNRVGLAGRQNEVFSGRLLQHEPHTLNVVLCCMWESDHNDHCDIKAQLTVSPITLSIYITEV